MQLDFNSLGLIQVSRKQKTRLREAATGLKMGVYRGSKTTNNKDDSNFPTPESDRSPKLTQFVNDVGEFYEKCFDWPFNPVRHSQSFRERVFAGISKYLNEKFARELRKELKLD